jgi:hypothetical protein
MAEQQRPHFTQEELLEQAAGNWNALFFAVLDYLREQELSPEEFVHWLGRRFAPGWEACRGDLQQVAYYAALNPVSLGSELRTYEVGENEATIQTSTDHLSASPEDIDLLGEIYRPIMEFLDLDYEWERWQEGTTLRVRRR